MTSRRFKCAQFRKGTLDFNFECAKLLQNVFCKQRCVTLNATFPDQDRIYQQTHLCRTFLLSIVMLSRIYLPIVQSLNIIRYIYSSKNLSTSTNVFPLFNTESLIFKIDNVFVVQGPFEIISRQDMQLVHINSFQKANRVNKIRPTDSEKFENF